jgi:hypothetical protein
MVLGQVSFWILRYSSCRYHSIMLHTHSFITLAIQFNLRHRASVNNAPNILKTKRNLLHIRNQCVPRCKHNPLRL